MQDKIDLECLPELVKSGKMSIKKAVNVIAEQIHKNPSHFGLGRYDEDFRSDFLVKFLQCAHKLFLRYDSQSAKFSTYLYSFTRGLFLSQLRNLNNENEIEYTSRQEEECMWEYKTRQFIPDMCVADNFYKNKNYIFHEIGQPVKNYCSTKRNEPSQKTAIVLALKSSFFLSDRHISLISDYCGIERENLEDAIRFLNKPLEKRAEQCAQLQARRDNAYYFHRKYSSMLKKGATSDTKEKLERKYEHQTENWESKNMQLQRTGYRLCPTNKTVANILGICERQVSYYITRARRNAENSDSDKN